MSTLKYIFFISFIILISLFASKNMHSVEVHFFDGPSVDRTLRVPTTVLISCAFGLGFLMAWFFELFAQIKLKSQLRKKQKIIEKLEKELTKTNQPSDPKGEVEGSFFSHNV